jgi:ABC-type phosphate transport system substrate-binding protein
MKMMTFKLIIILAFVVIFASCNEGNKQKPQEEQESITNGTLTVYCDESMAGLLKKPFELYDSTFPKVKLTVIPTNARRAMGELLSANARIVILARDYLKDEDSLMKVYKVEKHKRMKMADDGLVFFSNSEFPLDTLNSEQIYKILTDKNAGLRQYFPQLKSEPEIVINNNNSSEYANLVKLVARNNEIKKKLIFVDSSDKVVEYVKNNKNAIGVTYFYKIVNDGSVKALRIGFTDTTGKYISPKPVHQSYIVQRLYPYIIYYYSYLLKDMRDLPWWLASFLEKEAVVQRYFLNAGIVPGFAKIKIIREE